MESTLRGSVPNGTRLIETFGWSPSNGAPLLSDHLERMRRSAASLGFPYDEARAKDAIEISSPHALRCRLTLGEDGDFEFSTSNLGPTVGRWTVKFATQRLQSGDPWLRHKTTMRDIYDAARANLPAGVDERLFINEKGELCEGTITNLFVETAHGAHLTPALSSGLLPGILRKSLIADGWNEAVMTPDILETARNIWMGNALRGLIPVVVLDASGKPFGPA